MSVPLTGSVLELTACPLCGGATFKGLAVPRRLFGHLEGKIGLCRCVTCSFLFVNPRPNSKDLQRFYSGDDYSCHEEDSSLAGRAHASFLLRRFESHVSDARRKALLDFGCGGGFLLREARDQGWNAQGFDVGEGRLKCARNRVWL